MKKYRESKLWFFMNIVFILFILTIGSSCNKTSDVPGPNEVLIKGVAFNPSTITVASGTTITWTNKDEFEHTVTSNTGIFDSGPISPNGTFSHTFNTVGSFSYHCSIHSTMTASVTVN